MVLSQAVDGDLSTAATHFSNEWDKAAFAGWTYKHTDLAHLLARIDDHDLSEDEET